jgi:hypothetical protein
VPNRCELLHNGLFNRRPLLIPLQLAFTPVSFLAVRIEQPFHMPVERPQCRDASMLDEIPPFSSIVRQVAAINTFG